jgi:hypothetical protein
VGRKSGYNLRMGSVLYKTMSWCHGFVYYPLLVELFNGTAVDLQCLASGGEESMQRS